MTFFILVTFYTSFSVFKLVTSTFFYIYGSDNRMSVLLNNSELIQTAHLNDTDMETLYGHCQLCCHINVWGVVLFY